MKIKSKKRAKPDFDIDSVVERLIYLMDHFAFDDELEFKKYKKHLRKEIINHKLRIGIPINVFFDLLEKEFGRFKNISDEESVEVYKEILITMKRDYLIEEILKE